MEKARDDFGAATLRAICRAQGKPVSVSSRLATTTALQRADMRNQSLYDYELESENAKVADDTNMVDDDNGNTLIDSDDADEDETAAAVQASVAASCATPSTAQAAPANRIAAAYERMADAMVRMAVSTGSCRLGYTEKLT